MICGVLSGNQQESPPPLVFGRVHLAGGSAWSRWLLEGLLRQSALAALVARRADRAKHTGVWKDFVEGPPWFGVCGVENKSTVVAF